MDGNHFDALAKHLSSRRTALGGLLTGVFLTVDAAARGKNTQRKRKEKDRRKGKGNGKSKNRRRDRDQADTQATTCWRGGACMPRKGANVSQCDLESYTAAPGLDCTGCNLSRANLREATFIGANFTRANLSGACLIDADFTNATFANNTNLANAIFCRTKMPNGSVNNSSCGAGTACCASCIAATCQSLGKTCGSWPDGCGGTLQCGTCGAGQICDGSTCRACTVNCAAANHVCAGTDLQARLGAATTTPVYICPGRYTGTFSLGAAKTVIGAGQGENPAVDTLLDGAQTARVLHIPNQTGAVNLERLHLTGGATTHGGGILHEGTSLTMADCTVANNAASGAGVRTERGRTVTMTRCTVRNNRSDSFNAGGLSLRGPATLTDCLITRNTGSVGGGIEFFPPLRTDELKLLGTTEISHNTAGLRGGGIELINGTVTIAPTCRLFNNTAPATEGGGICNEGGIVILQGGNPSQIVTNNCRENCAGDAIAGCTETQISCPA